MMATGGSDEFADRAIDRDRITGRLDAAEMKKPGVIGDETPAQVHLGLPGILVLVEPFRRRMPDIDLGPGDRTTFAIFDRSMHDKPWTGCRRAHQRIPACAQWLIFTPERPEHVRLGFGLAVVAVVEKTNQRRHAE